MSDSKKSVLFVCLGNICRSPIAEAVFRDLIKKKGVEDQWIVDSSAVIGYHTGKQPEKRTLLTLKKYGIEGYEHRARVTSTADFRKFDTIFGMDEENMKDLRDLKERSKDGTAKVEKLSDYDPQGTTEVIDPYYFDGTDMFDQVFEQCVRCCTAFLDKNS